MGILCFLFPMLMENVTAVKVIESGAATDCYKFMLQCFAPLFRPRVGGCEGEYSWGVQGEAPVWHVVGLNRQVNDSSVVARLMSTRLRVTGDGPELLVFRACAG